ncbi:hypothetical protein DMN91_008013 [Ooceraea biroi]|uniref:DNA-directed DNA polymerase n=1 Tax=Ooceraea biroi TaxID=2015173 RepID=A0A3L8DGL3_OOCBI|nr:hypothetical protein DMN91_008013 [Ooceraea biroi]
MNLSRGGEDCVSWFVGELGDLAWHVKAILVQRAHEGAHPGGAGPAHSTCNLNYKDSHVIPVIFHNLSGYDAHSIIEDVANTFEGSVELLLLTKERYIAFTKNVANTKDRYGCGTSHMRIIRSEFRHLSEDDFELLTRKGVFPYVYVDSAERLLETCLPPRESFHSSLIDDTYSDLYLMTDVLLLADVFQNFRDTCIRSYGLDPAHYFTLPGYTWDAMLLHTGIEFELLTDVDMVLFVERGVRGGLSQCSHRYARANNRHAPFYDPSEPSTYLMYYDVNNLYGWAMCQPFPSARFRWVEDIATLNLSMIPSDSPTGYIFEVDLEYPRHLHNAYSDLPFCPTREAPPNKREEKLLATLCDKKRYVVHYRILQQCTRHGLHIKRIHRAWEFAQSAWLRDYIELNTGFRTRATNDFKKNLYKLMNNAVFDKTMENVRNRVDVKLGCAGRGDTAPRLLSRDRTFTAEPCSERIFSPWSCAD